MEGLLVFDYKDSGDRAGLYAGVHIPVWNRAVSGAFDGAGNQRRRSRYLLPVQKELISARERDSV